MSHIANTYICVRDGQLSSFCLLTVIYFFSYNQYQVVFTITIIVKGNNLKINDFIITPYHDNVCNDLVQYQYGQIDTFVDSF